MLGTGTTTMEEDPVSGLWFEYSEASGGGPRLAGITPSSLTYAVYSDPIGRLNS